MTKQRYVIGSLVFGTAAAVVPWLMLQPAWALLRDVPKPSAHMVTALLKVNQLVPLLMFANALIVAAITYVALQLVTPTEAEQMPKGRVEHLDAQLEQLKGANAELVRLQTQLVAADRLATVGKLAAGVAHEVGNPLSGILGYTSLLRSRVSSPEALEIVERVEDEVQRIDHIVRSLLELGRPSRGGVEPFDLRPLIDASVRLISATGDFGSIAVEVVAPDRLYVLGEPGPLSQVLVNLLLNAAQAMGGNGHIRVSVETIEGCARVNVDDDGPGIPPEVMPHLFTLFFTTKQPGKGTGLGLAMSRHLLSQFGATLGAENRPGGGARFLVSVPLAQV